MDFGLASLLSKYHKALDPDAFCRMNIEQWKRIEWINQSENDALQPLNKAKHANQ